MNNSAMIIRTMDDAERAARAMSGSGFFSDAKQASQAVVKILAGAELGFGPFASMTGVNIIQNKPTLSANLIAAAVKRSGKYNYRIVKLDNAECVLEFQELMPSGQFMVVGTSTFTMKDAEIAGLAAKENWRKYPKNMLFARAISNGQRFYAPDAFNGATVYTPDELGAAEDAEGNVVITPVGKLEDNPAPIPEALWQHWTALVERADKLKVPHADVDRARITPDELIEAGKELRGFVEEAEEQERAAHENQDGAA